MIEKLVNMNQKTMADKIDEIIDTVNGLEEKLNKHMWPILELTQLKTSPLYNQASTTISPTISKLEMLRACLDDLEEEIRKGSI